MVIIQTHRVRIYACPKHGISFKVPFASQNIVNTKLGYYVPQGVSVLSLKSDLFGNLLFFENVCIKLSN